MSIKNKHFHFVTVVLTPLIILAMLSGCTAVPQPPAPEAPVSEPEAEAPQEAETGVTEEPGTDKIENEAAEAKTTEEGEKAETE